LSITVRPALETAGQIVWLLSDTIDGEVRARRYLIWRLDDLRSRRLMLRDFRVGEDEGKAALADLDREEEELLELAAHAKFDTRATIYHSEGHIEAAGLLGPDGKA